MQTRRFYAAQPAAYRGGERKTLEIAERWPGRGVDKSVLSIAEPRRYRNKEHLRFVMQQPCLVCGRTPSDPHHLRFMQPRALGRKVSDEFVAPLCRTHHREVHRVGDERAWWKQASINPIKVARQLWRKTRLNERATRREPVTEPTGLATALRVDRATPRHRRERSHYAHDLAARSELFHTASGTAFADLMIDGHRETWPIRGARFRSWLKRCYYEVTGGVPSAAAIRSALDLLEARAQFDGPQRAVH